MIHWSPNPDIFSAGAFHLRWYSLMFLFGFSGGYQLMRWVCLRENRNFSRLENLLVYVFVGTTVGARLGHCLFYEPEYFLSHPIEILKIWNGGLASHGGTVGVIFALWLYNRKYPEFSMMWLLDRMTLPTALTAGLIRIGNLMNSEIIGRPTDVPCSFVFERIDKIPRHPTQIYESFTYLFLLFILLVIYKRDKNPRPGLMFGLTMAWIFLWRIFWEFFKENQVPFESSMTLNMGQILSIPFVVLGIFFMVRAFRMPKPVPMR